MVNLYSLNAGVQAGGGMVTNRFTQAPPAATDPPAPMSYAAASQGDLHPAPANWAVNMVQMTAAAPTDIIDTVGASLRLTQRGQINAGVYNAIGMPNFARWVSDNQSGVEATSGLLGTVIIGAGAEIAAEKVLTSGWLAATGLGRVTSPIISKIASIEAGASDASYAAAQAGESLGVWSGANGKLLLSKGVQGFVRAGFSEAVIAATMNKNTAVWSDDMSQNLLFGALGLAAGSGLGVMSGRGMVYRWANSDEVRYARALRADPGGYATDLQDASLNALVGSTTALSPRTIKPSAEITSWALDSHRDDLQFAGIGPQRPVAERTAIQTAAQVQLREKMQGLTKEGIPGSPGTGFLTNATPGQPAHHLLQTLAEDPTTMYGGDRFGQIPRDKTAAQIMQEYTDHADALIASKDPDKMAEGAAMHRRVGLVLVNKTWMTPADAKAFTEYHPYDSQYTPPTVNGVVQMQYKAGFTGKKYTINEDGRINTKDYESLPVQDLIGLHEGMVKLHDVMLKKGMMVAIPKNATHYQLDFALEYLRKGGQVDFTNLGKGAGADVAQLKSLELKQIASMRFKTLGVHERFVLNLPQQTSSERITDPNGAFLRNWLNVASQPGTDLALLRDYRLKGQRALGLTSDIKGTDDLSGGVFGFNRDLGKPEGRWMAPVVGMFDDTPAAKWHQHVMSDAIQEGKTATVQMLSSTKNAPVTGAITQVIMRHPLVRAAMDIAGLDDSQLAGTLSAVEASASTFLTQAMRFRNAPALAAAQDIRRVVNRITEISIDAAYTRLKPITERLNATAAAKSKILFNQYYSHAGGWDISKSVVQPDGTLAFLLNENSEVNFARLGRTPRRGELLTNERTGKVIILDSLGDEMRKGLETEMTALLNERNAVRQAFGLPPIDKKDFYVAPPSTQGKFVGFTLDSTNRAVPGGGIVADSADEFRQIQKDLQAEWNSQGKDYRVMSNDEIRSHADLWDQARLDYIDPTKMAGPSGVKRGALSSRDINPQSLDDALTYLKRGYEQNATGSVRSIFDSQLRISRMRQAAQVATKGEVPGAKTIWQTYDETLLGIPSSANPRGVAAIFKTADDAIDKVIAAAWGKRPVPREWMDGLLGVLGYHGGVIRGKRIGLSDVKSFNDLSTALGPYVPFASAMDMAKYTHSLTPPPTMKGMTRSLNRLGAGILLRWGEIPQAAMNMTGIITNMPGLLSNRNVPIMGKVGKVNVIDSMKIMSKGFARMLSERSGADWDTMVKNGDSSQDFAEWHTRMSLIKDHNTFGKIMLGNPAIDYKSLPKLSAERSRAFLAHHGVEGMVSLATDSTESLSRVWAHFVGLELADHHGIVGQEARHYFARQIANDTIANYDPLNRPEIFNSGVGSMYGLFLSYSQNYYQRMFRWLENEDYASVGKSLAAQASMFGFAGTPGFNQLAALRDTLTGNDGEEGSGLLENIYKRYGSGVGSVVAHGGFDQLIHLLSFGAVPAIAFHTRGDQNFRTPASDFLTNGLQVPTPPGLEVLKDLMTGTFGVIDQMVNHRDTTSMQYMAEIMARTMPNRMIHGALTVLAAGGKDADVNGNLMAETKGLAETMYRFLGLRSARQQAEIEGYFQNEKAKQIDAARQDKVRVSTRALVRSGQYDKLPAVFDSYLAAGGKPWNYPTWLKSIISEAGNTRTQNQLLQSLRGPAHQALARRIELFTGGG